MKGGIEDLRPGQLQDAGAGGGCGAQERAEGGPEAVPAPSVPLPPLW